MSQGGQGVAETPIVLKGLMYYTYELNLVLYENRGPFAQILILNLCEILCILKGRTCIVLKDYIFKDLAWCI